MQVKVVAKAWKLVVCVGALALLGGCSEGGGSTTEEIESVRRPDQPVRKVDKPVKRVDIRLSSPLLTKGKMLPDDFTCDPSSVWLPLRWSGVPDGAEELVLYGARVRHESVGSAGVATLVSGALIGGLRPVRNGLDAGPLPDGAFFIPGLSPDGLCLPAKSDEELTFQLYALASEQRFDRSPHGVEEVLKRFEKALAVGTIFAPFSSSSKG